MEKFYHYFTSYVYQKESQFYFKNTELQLSNKISSYEDILKFRNALAKTLKINAESITILNYTLINNKKY